MEEFKQSLAHGERSGHDGLDYRDLFKAHINTQVRHRTRHSEYISG